METTRQLQLLIDTVPALVWSTTAEGAPTWVNRRFTEVTGAALEDITAPDGKLALNVIHPDDRAAAAQAVAHSFETGEPYFARYRQLRRDGSWRWTETRAEPLRDDSGNIVQWYGVSVDIDDMVSAQQALHERERELSLLVDMVPSHLWRLDPDGEPIFFNKRMVDFLGLDVPDTDRPGSSRLEAVIENVHPEDAPRFRQMLHRCLVTGERFSLRYRLRRADGTYRWMSSRAEPTRDQDGRITQWYGLCHDIDDQLRSEEALRRASEKLAQATQAASLAELSAAIAHEVNQPLAAIAANAHACRRWLDAEPPNIERARVTVERILRDTDSAAEVVDRIRALFRQSVQTRSATALGSLLEEVRDLMAEEAARCRVRLAVEVESGLPPVALDRVQVQQVLINLARNGVEAMDCIAGDKVLEMRARRTGDVVQTRISDRGRGIEFPERIFEPFFTTKHNGMGMGLAICRSIIESHGGQLWAEKNEPSGAAFVFTLPVEAKTAP